MPALKYDIVPYWFNTSTPRGANSEIEIHFHLFPYTDSFLRRDSFSEGRAIKREISKREKGGNWKIEGAFNFLSPGSTRLIPFSPSSTR